MTVTTATTDKGGAAGVQIEHHQQQQQSSRIVLPNFLQSVNLKYVKLGYHYLISNLLTLCLVPLIIITLIQASQTTRLEHLHHLWLHLQYNLLTCSAVLVFGLTLYAVSHPHAVYLLDFSCFRPADHLKMPFHNFMEYSRLIGAFDDSSLDLQHKVLLRSGLGEETYVPEALHFIPPRPSMSAVTPAFLDQ